MAGKTPEAEGGPEPISSLLDHMVEAIKKATNDTERATAVDTTSKRLDKLTKDQIDIEIDEADRVTKNIEKNGKWVGKNTEFTNKQAYKNSGDPVKELESSKALLKATFNKSNPTWLASGAEEIQHCSQAAEFVSRVSLLPASLRDNPDILYKEAMRYSASVPWGTMTIEAEKEANRILDRAMKQIRLQRNEGAISSEQGVTERMLQTLTQSSIDTGKTPVFYVGDEMVKTATKDGRIIIGKELDSELVELQKQIRDDDALIHDPVQLSKTIQRLKDEFGQDNVSLYVAKLRHMTQTETTVRNDARNEKYWSNLGLHEVSMIPTWQDEKELRWGIERLLQEQERLTRHYPNGEVVESIQQHTKLIMGYLGSDDYIKDLTEYAMEKFNGDAEEVRKHVFKMRNELPKLQEKIQARGGAAVTYGHIKLAGDPETIAKSILPYGTRGINLILSENGGINEMVYNRYINLMKLGRFNPDHKLEAYTGTTLKELRQRLKKEINEDMGLFDKKYHKCWGGDRHLDDPAIDAVIRQVEVVVAISQQDLVAVLDAPGPAERGRKVGDFIASSSFLSMNTGERFLSAMDVDAYAFEKWGKLTDYPLYMWRRMCEMAAKGDPIRRAAIKEMLKGVKQGDKRFMELAEEAFGNKEKMAKILELEYKANNRFLQKSPKTFDQLTMKDLENELVVQEGKKIVTEILEAYDDFSSGWRIKEYLIQINKMYGIQAPEGEAAEAYLFGPHHLGLGMQLRLAGYDLIHAETEGKREHHAKTVQKVLRNEIAQYRPQAIMEFLYTNHDEKAMDEFQKMVNGGKLTRARLGEGVKEDITHIDQYYHYISRRFISINDALADKGLPPINYTVGPSPEQLAVVNEICSVTKVNTAAYLDVMKEATSFAGKEENIKKLTETRYDHIYHRTRWVDDLRMRHLENPDFAPGSRTKKEYDDSHGTITHIPLSEVFVEGGSGGGDQHPRAWNDLGVALSAMDALTAALTHDKKQFFENVKKVYDAVGRYSGYKPSAARAAIYMLGGFGEAAATDPVTNVFMLNALENTSPARRLVGDKGLSNSPGENLELAEEMEGVLIGKLHNLAPHLAEEAEKFIGVRWGWTPDQLGELGHHLPAWADRAKIAIILAGLLLVAQSAKTIDEEASGKKK